MLSLGLLLSACGSASSPTGAHSGSHPGNTGEPTTVASGQRLAALYQRLLDDVAPCVTALDDAHIHMAAWTTGTETRDMATEALDSLSDTCDEDDSAGVHDIEVVGQLPEISSTPLGEGAKALFAWAESGATPGLRALNHAVQDPGDQAARRAFQEASTELEAHSVVARREMESARALAGLGQTTTLSLPGLPPAPHPPVLVR